MNDHKTEDTRGGRPPGRHRFSPRPGPDRPRGAPPEQTGAETNYIVKNIETRTPMVVKLVDNEEVRGWIEYYDSRMIKLNRRQPPHLFIRKDNIKYMYKDEGAANAPRKEGED